MRSILRRTTCSNDGCFKFSIFGFQGNSWVQQIAQRDERSNILDDVPRRRIHTLIPKGHRTRHVKLWILFER